MGINAKHNVSEANLAVYLPGSQREGHVNVSDVDLKCTPRPRLGGGFRHFYLSQKSNRSLKPEVWTWAGPVHFSVYIYIYVFSSARQTSLFFSLFTFSYITFFFFLFQGDVEPGLNWYKSRLMFFRNNNKLCY